MATPYRATERVITAPAPSVLSTNRVLRNTYLLLALTLAFSAVTAGVAMATNMGSLGLLPTLLGYFGLLFLTQYLRNSAWGLLAVFALTGFMGLTLGPMLNAYMGAFANGPQLVATAFGGTAAVFVGLSAYALTTRRDFTFMGGMLFAGILVAFLAGLAAYFFEMPGLGLTPNQAAKLFGIDANHVTRLLKDLTEQGALVCDARNELAFSSSTCSSVLSGG